MADRGRSGLYDAVFQLCFETPDPDFFLVEFDLIKTKTLKIVLRFFLSLQGYFHEKVLKKHPVIYIIN